MKRWYCVSRLHNLCEQLEATPVPSANNFRKRLFYIDLIYAKNVAEKTDPEYCKEIRHMKACLDPT